MTTTFAKILSAGYANSCKENVTGMLPLHYACQLGASVDVIEILADHYDEPLENAKDKQGKTPLHYIYENPYSVSSCYAAAFIIERAPDSVNMRDKRGNLPLRSLSMKTSQDTLSEDQKEHALKILDFCLNANPVISADFLATLHTLPEWLRDRAIMSPYIQKSLNEKIILKVPTVIRFCDGFVYILILLIFYLGAACTIQERIPDIDESKNCDKGRFGTILFITALYLILREVMQVLSLLSLGIMNSYLEGSTNYLDILTIVLIIYFALDMQTENGFLNMSNLCKGDPECVIEKLDIYRFLVSMANVIFWSTFISFLKSASIDLAVFVDGLQNVISRILPFLTALVIILHHFSIAFVMIYVDSDRCRTCIREGDDQCASNFCETWHTLLKVATMLLGEVAAADFEDEDPTVQDLGRIYFLLFMFLVAILLANVLIAIVTDSYGIVKNERAAIVFWTNKLDYISECMGIIDGPWRNRVRELFFLPAIDENIISNDEFGYELWNRVTQVHFERVKVWKFEFWVVVFYKLVTYLFIAVWLPVGLLTFGYLWPPQVRKYILYSRITSDSVGELKELEQRSIEVRSLKEEVKDLQQEIFLEMTNDRREIISLKTQFRDMKESLETEMMTVKEIVTMLFDLQSL